MSLPNPFLTQNSTPAQNHPAAQHVPQINQNFQQNQQKNFRGQPQRHFNGQRGQYNNNYARNQDPVGNFGDPAGNQFNNRFPHNKRNFHQRPPPNNQNFNNFQDPAGANNFHPPNNPFCSYCNESFPSPMELQVHRRSHQKCPYDECKFNANELTVSEHIQKVHIGTKIKDLTSPEDIAKWREERRKRYPTTANVQLRQQIQEMKQNRGEKLHDSKARFGDNKQKDFFQRCDEEWRERKREKKEKIRKQKEELKQAKKKARKLVKKMVVESPSKKEVKVKMTFKGTKDMKDYHKEEPKVNSLSLLNTYGSDSESEDESKDDKKLNESFGSVSSSVEKSEKSGSESEDDEGDKIVEDDHKTVDDLQNNSLMLVDVQEELVDGNEVTQSGITDSKMQFESLSSSDGNILGNKSSSDSQKSSTADKDPEELPDEIKNTLGDSQDSLKDALIGSNPQDTSTNDDYPQMVDDDAPEELSIPKEDYHPLLEPTSSKRKQLPHNKNPKRPKTAIDYSKLKSLRSSNPFLEKLLHREIVHERNYLLQCVNFVVKNNFFGVGR